MNRDSLTILSYNPNGLWWGQEGSTQADGKKGRLDLEIPYVQNKFGNIDLICIQETHLQKEQMDGLPRILQGYAWIHAPTGPEDKFAGVSIGYKHWMPKPEDLMERFGTIRNDMEK